MKCPKCKREVEALYRDKPKGQIAEFVCINCVPETTPKPDKDTTLIAKEISRALNRNK